MEKDKKKTLTISSNLKKKIDTSRISPSGKKTYSVDKKKLFRPNKSFNKISSPNLNLQQDSKKKILLESLSSNKLQKISLKKIINH